MKNKLITIIITTLAIPFAFAEEKHDHSNESKDEHAEHGEDDHGNPGDLLKPYPADEMTAWPIGARVGNVRNNDPSLIEPLTERA